MLALRMVTARVLIFLSGSFTSQIETDRHKRDSPIHEEYTFPNVESQIVTSQLPVPGIEPVPPALEADVVTTTPPALSISVILS